jgi:hypothetical protein
MQTTPETQLHDEYAIYQTILHARNRRLTHDYEINTEDTPENFQRDMLLGYCHENSLAAAEHLAEHYDPAIHSKDLCNEEGYRKLVGNGHRLG